MERILSIKGTMLDKKQLENYLEKLAAEHVLKDYSDKDTYPIPRVIENLEVIEEVYQLLNEHVKLKLPIHPAGEWILDNFYLVEETAKTIIKNLNKKKYTNFVGLAEGPYRGFARVYVVSSEIVAYTEGKIEANTLIDLLTSYQRKKAFSMEEIWNLSIFLQISLLENIRFVCEKIYSSQLQKYRVENILERLVENKQKEELCFQNVPAYRSKISCYADKYPFMEYMSYRLKKYGKKSIPFFNILEEQANQMGTSINEIIKKEHFDIATKKVLIGNCIKSIKDLMRINFAEIFEEVNGTNEILKQDPAEVYEKMDYNTKNYYRNKIKEIAKKSKMAEIYIAKKIVKLAKKAKQDIEEKKIDNTIENQKRTHIGYYLIEDGINELYFTLGIKGKKVRKKEIKVKYYIFLIFVLTVLASISIGVYITYKTNNLILGIILSVLMCIPINQAIIQIIQYVSGKIVKPKILPKLDMQEGVSKKDATFIVIPTIVNSKEKVQELMKKLEVYYLANESENIYLALLGDCTSSKNEKEEIDEKIIREGIEEVKKLNEKYKDKEFPKFHFIYRKRVWNAGEKEYLGWERKRGLLNQFNEYILQNIENPFRYNSIKTYLEENENAKIPKIKYIITLDSDTDLSLNSGLELIGAMSHILNLPVLNKEQTVVIGGHALIQPRIGIHMDASRKSKFTKIFAGYGGTDLYTNAISDFYWDNFGEGIFTGKGIYDVSVFSKVLENTIPQNTVLSHDLLEGSYLRCGLATDILLLDGFPFKYNSYMLRLHRWIRGDFQITEWLKKYVKDKKENKVYNPLNILSKYKIWDNLKRSTVDIFLVLSIITLVINSLITKSFIYPILALLLVIAVMPWILDTINYIVFKKDGQQTQITFSPIYTGLKASFFRGIINLGCIPYKAYVSINAIIKTCYRKHISHQNMLEWTTAEDAEKQAKTDLVSYCKTMWINILLGIILILIASTKILQGYYIILEILGILWTITPIIMWYVSKEIILSKKIDELDKQEKEYILDIAKRTWKYFKDYMVEENNFLPPDNYQDDRIPKVVKRTSSTNIGLGILAVISSYYLGFENQKDTISLLNLIIQKIDVLSKWNGHLYNWYDIQTLEPLKPSYVSTVDSGNFVSYLYTLKSFLIKELEKKDKMEKETIEQIKYILEVTEKIIKNTDFSKLYSEETRLFSIGFSMDTNKLENSYYDLLASEARNASLIAISKKDIPSKHWNNLSRSLTVLNKHKGLISWAGTSFEYLMPNIIIPTYEGTLLDESCKFMVYSQQEYSKKLGIPWGISESAFNLKDLNGNYQYKSFGIPWLGLKRGLADEMVASPYGSILAINQEPKEVLKNIKELEKQGALGNYGFYEAVDYTPSRLKPKQRREIIKTYMAHHQGLILVSITNLFKDNIMQKRFIDNSSIQAVNILLEERMPENMIITKEKKEKPQKLVYTDYEDYSERIFTKMDLDFINSNVVSNEDYTIVINEKGEGYSKYKDICVNRYKQTADKEQGIFFFLKNIRTKRIWTTGQMKYLAKPDKRKTVFAPDISKFTRLDGDMETTLKVFTATNENVEIRRLSVKNVGNGEETLEITSYFEPILSRLEADYSHMAFNNLFLTFDYDPKLEMILTKRKTRTKEEKQVYLATTLYTTKETIGELEYEIDKEKIIGRGNLGLPQMIANSKPFSRSVGFVTDPAICLKKTIKIKPGETVYLNLILSISEEKATAISNLQKFRSEESIENELELSKAKIEAENRYLGLKGKQIETYQQMLNFIMFPNELKALNSKTLSIKNYPQSELWKYGISGDLPILLLKIKDIGDIDVLKETLKAYEYYRIKNIYIDFVILNEEKKAYEEYVREGIEGVIANSHLAYMRNQHGGIFIIQAKEIENKEAIEFRANFIIDSHLGNLKSQIRDKIEEYIEKRKNIGLEENKLPIVIEENFLGEIWKNKKMKYDNEYGGFSEDGKEFFIRVNENEKLPTVWSHILANKNFGSLVTESGGGFTWSNNSRLYRLTAWSNMPVEDIPSEIIYLKDKEKGQSWSLQANGKPDKNDYYATFGFGYSKYVHECNGLNQELNTFVPIDENVKINIITLKNHLPERRNLKLIYYIKPVLDEDELKSNGKINITWKENANLIYAKNLGNETFKDQICYISSSEKISSYTGNKNFFMGEGGISNPHGLNCVALDNENALGRDSIIAIQISITLESFEEKDISFIIGTGKSLIEIQDKAYQYTNISNSKRKLEETKNYWNNLLGTLQVETPIESINIMLNGWSTYQAIAGRLWAKSGFYQSGGAFGFRDQLQDTLGLKYLSTEFMKNQILLASEHQFKEGDVLHWWHEDTGRGIRTKFSDDLLWLPYTVAEYISFTGDMSILDEKTSYLTGDILKDGEEERYDYYPKTEEKESIWEHCKKAINRSFSFGEHGLPKIGTGDWNDGMSTVGNKGKGESVWLGFFLYDVLQKIILIAKEKNEEEVVIKYEEVKDKLKRALNTNAWDGRWYKRAYMDSGEALGSIENEECRIDNISQTWSVISGAGDNDKKYISMESLENHLVDNEHGLIKLLDPPFEKGKLEPGYIKGYLPGVRENGGQYTHAATWTIIAEALLGFGDKATNYFKMINPIEHARTKESAKKYKVEPYVIAADIYSSNYLAGRGGWTWYTGSASWYYKAGIEYILGFKIEKRMLSINPCIPKDWKEYQIHYKYGSSIYNIKVKNPKNKNTGVDKFILNGEEIEEKKICLQDNNGIYNIEVIM